MRIEVEKSAGGIFAIYLRNDCGDVIWIDDTPHRSICNESEILARAAALRGATGWPISKEYD